MMADSHGKTRPLEPGYPLGKGFAAAARLNLQHYIFRDLLGYALHPDIPLPEGGNDLSIADIGTGTGIWLTDVHQQLPFAQLDGFDNSVDQYPPQQWLPPNVSLRGLDICASIPNELLGKYDVIHVRHFLLVVEDDPKSLLKNLVALLKPGGYLQWVEYDPLSVRIDTIDSSLQQAATESFLATIRGGRDYNWVAKLPEYFDAAGLTTTTSTTYPVPPELQMSFTYVLLLAAEEISFVALDNDGPESGGSVYRRHLKAVFEECKSGVSMVWSPRVHVGRKKF